MGWLEKGLEEGRVDEKEIRGVEGQARFCAVAAKDLTMQRKNEQSKKD